MRTRKERFALYENIVRQWPTSLSSTVAGWWTLLGTIYSRSFPVWWMQFGVPWKSRRSLKEEMLNCLLSAGWNFVLESTLVMWSRRRNESTEMGLTLQLV